MCIIIRLQSRGQALDFVSRCPDITKPGLANLLRPVERCLELGLGGGRGSQSLSHKPHQSQCGAQLQLARAGREHHLAGGRCRGDCGAGGGSDTLHRPRARLGQHQQDCRGHRHHHLQESG